LARKNFGKRISHIGSKATRKMIMKLTPEVISPTFYEQLLCTPIPKAQKVSFCTFGISSPIKAAFKTLVKSTLILQSESFNFSFDCLQNELQDN